ncbi:hypothetical protein BDN70DRAFT_876565 [Pholiota conissans]|uniref:Uncharacterized protein n=1 Tax=Pholiota conissans TaxID=109636 RepID=A0A9P5Z519_9AGAR|nr:hypothetical protein BDN70DRAFT_876565 [Pholiota conissans]
MPLLANNESTCPGALMPFYLCREPRGRLALPIDMTVVDEHICLVHQTNTINHSIDIRVWVSQRLGYDRSTGGMDCACYIALEGVYDTFVGTKHTYLGLRVRFPTSAPAPRSPETKTVVLHIRTAVCKKGKYTELRMQALCVVGRSSIERG